MGVIFDPILGKIRSGKSDSSGGTGIGFKAVYSTHAVLIANETASGTGNFFLVRQTTSTAYFFNRKQAGIWIDDPDTLAFEHLGSAPTVFADGELAFYNSADNTKEIDFDLSGITTATRRTLTFQDKDGTVALAGVEIIITTSTTETVDVTTGTVIRQTANGITTSLSGHTTGRSVYIKNAGGGDNTLNITVDGDVSPVIKDGESFHIMYNGTDWDLL
tara:strand:- start:1190 stop:1843 length:654 start_codon:yes stop_codon:yes gene_type:complete